MRHTFTLANGVEIPAVGFGTYKAADNTDEAIISEAIRHGYRHLDTAAFYFNEEAVGKAVRESGIPREEIFLTSKVWKDHLGYDSTLQEFENSCKRLGTDYLDLYLYHWRGGTPLAETVDMLENMAAKGKIKAWGVSNFDLEDMQELFETPGGRNCQANQVLYHLGSRGIEVALKPWQDQQQIPTIAYCPLAQAGALQRDLIQHPAVQQTAAELGISVYQVLLCFTLAQSNMVSIPRTGKTAHMKEIADCLAIRLSGEQLAVLNQAFPAPKRRVPLDIE